MVHIRIAKQIRAATTSCSVCFNLFAIIILAHIDFPLLLDLTQFSLMTDWEPRTKRVGKSLG